MGTHPVEAEPDIKSIIEATQNRMGAAVCIWYLWPDNSPGYCTFAHMHALERWHLAPDFWTQERAVVLRSDGLFETCRNPVGGFGQKGPGFIPIRTQWALRPIPPASYAVVAEQFNITPSQLEKLFR